MAVFASGTDKTVSEIQALLGNNELDIRRLGELLQGVDDDLVAQQIGSEIRKLEVANDLLRAQLLESSEQAVSHFAQRSSPEVVLGAIRQVDGWILRTQRQITELSNARVESEMYNWQGIVMVATGEVSAMVPSYFEMTELERATQFLSQLDSHREILVGELKGLASLHTSEEAAQFDRSEKALQEIEAKQRELVDFLGTLKDNFKAEIQSVDQYETLVAVYDAESELLKAYEEQGQIYTDERKTRFADLAKSASCAKALGTQVFYH